MRALDVNLATQPFRNNTLLWVAYGFGFTVLLAILSWNVKTWLDHRGFRQQAAERLAAMDRRMAELDRREVVARRAAAKEELALQGLTDQAVAANEVIDHKAFSWTRLFNRVEETIPWNVYLTSVRPLLGVQRDPRADKVRDERKSIVVSVEGYSQSLSAFLDFETALIAHPSFDYPEPKRHQLNERKEIVFELDFTYYPDAVEDVLEAAEDGEDAPAAEPGAAATEPSVGDATAADAVGAVGGEGPAAATVAGDAPPVEGDAVLVEGDAVPGEVDAAIVEGAPVAAGSVPDSAGEATDRAEGAATPAAPDAVVATPPATEGNAARPDRQPPRIPPRPYADAQKGDEAEKAKPPARRSPPRRKPKKDDEDNVP